jgi:methylmalonyl-CoA/ethylmalonyl-CoA epimerase
MQFDHIGVIAPTLEAGRAQLGAILEIPHWTEEFADPVNGVYAQFGLDTSGINYELIAPFGENSPIIKWVQTKRNILNHIAYLVQDLDKASAKISATGAVPTSAPKPAIAYGGNRIQFFVTPMRFIIELIEAPAHKHQYKKTYPTALQAEEEEGSPVSLP